MQTFESIKICFLDEDFILQLGLSTDVFNFTPKEANSAFLRYDADSHNTQQVKAVF